MVPRRDQGALFAFPFPYVDRGATPLDTVIPKKRRAQSASEAKSSGSEVEAADDRAETGSHSRVGPSAWRKVRRELARAEPPLFPPFLQARRRIHSKQQSIAVLTAIMQRCLQDGDFTRAGRAFGILLRTDFHDFNLDLRSRGLYGVGAELLLRQEQGAAPSPKGHQVSEQRAINWPSYIGFPQPKFAAAKAYYDRLAIDYAFRPVSSSLVSSLDFYPIMYGLWISIVQDRYYETLGVEDLAVTQPDPAQLANLDPATALQVQQGRNQAREGAYAIEASLKELMISPPYSESAYLQELLSMIGQWIRDLGRLPPVDDQLEGGIEDLSTPEPAG